VAAEEKPASRGLFRVHLFHAAKPISLNKIKTIISYSELSMVFHYS